MWHCREGVGGRCGDGGRKREREDSVVRKVGKGGSVGREKAKGSKGRKM